MSRCGSAVRRLALGPQGSTLESTRPGPQAPPFRQEMGHPASTQGTLRALVDDMERGHTTLKRPKPLRGS